MPGLSQRNIYSSLSEKLKPRPITEILYYFAFGLFFICWVIGKTTFFSNEHSGSLIVSLLQILVLFSLFLKFLLQNFSIRSLIISCLIVLLGFVSWRQSGEGWLFWVALFVVCSEGVKLRPLAAMAFFLSASTVVFALLLSNAGIIENVVTERDGVIRYAMGFTHPNAFGLCIVVVCVSFSVLRFGKSPFLDILLCLIGAYVLLAIPNSRTSAFLVVVQSVVLIVLFYVKKRRTRKILSLISLSMVIMFVVISFYFMVNYDPTNPLHAAINKALSGRLRLAHGYYEMQPLTFFGSSFQGFPAIYWEAGKAYDFIVDNAYCHLLLRYGYIPTIIFLFGLILLFGVVIKQNRWDALLFGLIMMSILSLSETIGICIECNYFLFAMGAELLYPKKPISASRTSFTGQRIESSCK